MRLFAREFLTVGTREQAIQLRQAFVFAVCLAFSESNRELVKKFARKRDFEQKTCWNTKKTSNCA
ncbi:hypothetical protein AYM40_22115 [Paraburkholderia phytofirmans OLGA172]|uniref:Uncharacterized protein n=1 Tax=Paraburkholderia phytofirmans OLGA172 TaxID=1417228 RepID=A0A160FR98_9BURK|nr:hypothetical protein [Paraburkholderia phytofirmans]ANB75116.1 hypothetical protein AYM40_22115 [Paraburkholderia phytofirmans OLGA172]